MCRFEGNSTDFRQNMRSLGEFLRSQQGPSFQPSFSIKEKADDPDLLNVRKHALDCFEEELTSVIGRNKSKYHRGHDRKRRISL